MSDYAHSHKQHHCWQCLVLPAIAAFAVFFVALPWIVVRMVPFIKVPSAVEKPTTEEAAPVACDYAIINALLVDGSGGEPYAGAVAITGDTIVAIGDIKVNASKKVIDAAGKIVCPGFIDLHTHTEEYWITSPNGYPALAQGVTTQIGGNCGTSPDDTGAYLDKLSSTPPAINIGLLTGYTHLRTAAGVAGSNKATASQIAVMQKLLAEDLADGSFGFSVGLGYWPQKAATTDELTALAKTVADADRLFAMHIRDEGSKVVPAVKEALTIAANSGVRLEYSHIKASGEANWSLQPQVLSMLDNAIAQGIDVQGDAYSYTYSSLDVPKGTNSMSEDNIRMVLSRPYVMLISDGGLYAGGQATHPRAYANTTHALIWLVRETKAIPLPEMVKKMTAMPAARLRLNDRGSLAVGKKADVLVFNLDDLQERATRYEPMQISYGMSYVFVNGELAVDDGNFTDIKNGRALHAQ